MKKEHEFALQEIDIAVIKCAEIGVTTYDTIDYLRSLADAVEYCNTLTAPGGWRRKWALKEELLDIFPEKL